MSKEQEMSELKLKRFSRKGFIILQCNQCGNHAEEPLESGKDPWDIWPGGCPRCGYAKADVSMIF